jgi:hypothetical protein
VTPEQFRAWQAIVRDAFIMVLGGFLLVWQCVMTVEPNIYVIGAGVTLLGVPAATRLDNLRRKGSGDE